MKKLIYSVMLFALGFFAASCQQESLESSARANTVSYNVQVPSALSSKAIGNDIPEVDELVYQVFRTAEVGDLTCDPVYTGTEPITDGAANFTLDFLNEQSYVVLFWAQNQYIDIYDTDDLRQVSIAAQCSANDRRAVVFAGYDEVEDCVSSASGNISLERIVSQINVGTTLESLRVGAREVVLSESSMTVSGLYSTYNVATGSVTGSDDAEIIFTAADIPAPSTGEELMVNGEKYIYVAMNYVGFVPSEGTKVDIDFSIITTEDEIIEHSVTDVTVKPNFRTNIIGNLISGTSSGIIEGDIIVVTPENISTTDFTTSGIYRLVGDFSNISSINITPAEGVNITLDAAQATFGSQILFNIPRVPDNANVVSRDNGRAGNYTLTRFNAPTLALGAYGTSVAVTNSTLHCIDVYAANISLDIHGNTIDSNYKMHPRTTYGQTTDCAAILMMMAYDLKFDDNTVRNAIGHAVAINGSKGIWGSNIPESENQILSFTRNTITGISGSTKNDCAGLKIWDDMTYAMNGETLFSELPQAGQELITRLDNDSSNVFTKATDTPNTAYKYNFYAYYHCAL